MSSSPIIHKGMLVILSSPSGGGKTSVYKKLLKRHPDFAYSVSVTTRTPRRGEKAGQDYVFTDEKGFRKMAAAGRFAEWAVVHNNLYGTLKSTVEEALAERKVLLFDIDVQGAKSLKELYQDAVAIFILPPSFDILKKRLIDRGTDSMEVIERRLKGSLSELKHINIYDYVAINDNLDECVTLIDRIIETQRYNIAHIERIEWGIPQGEV